MMTRIEAGEMIEPQDCKTVLVVTSLAFRPLSISELSALADLPLDIAETAVEMCGSFLAIVKGTVNLIHQSAEAWLLKKEKPDQRPEDGGGVVQRCICALAEEEGKGW
jgi:hypothetical protein